MAQDLFYLFPNQNYLDLVPYQAGCEKKEPNASFGPCQRQHYLFHYVLSGSGTLAADNGLNHARWFSVHAGQGFMIFPGQTTTYWADKEHPWEYVWVEFDGLYASEVLRLCGLTDKAPVYQSRDALLTEKMFGSMLEMAKAPAETQFYKIAKLYEFADCLIRSSDKAKNWEISNTMSDYYLHTAFSFIEHNYMNDINVEMIARQCNIHRNRLLHIFKTSIGKSPQQYLISYRMAKAAELLTSTGLNIREICSRVGYPDQLHFSRAFRNVYKMPPSEYRKLYTPAP